jgi:hypothetical protein
MKITTLHGSTVEPAVPDPMVVDLQRVNGRQVGIYDFSGTGVDAGNDADPANYEITTGALDVSGIGANTPVAVGGFVRPFGQAPADFEAQTVVDLSNVRAVIAINWNPATSAPFLMSSSESVTLNLSGAGLFHHVGRGRSSMDLNDFAGDPALAAATDGEGVFVIEQEGTRQVFTGFFGFVQEVERRLADGRMMRRLVASGFFDDNAVTLENTTVIAVSMI